jgi:tetratricopeptide (TPR) repeat protein
MLRRAQLDAGWELIRQGRMDEAARQFESLETSAETLSGLAAAQSGRGDHEAAVRTLERAVAIAPDRFDLKIKLARARLATRP